MFLKINKKYFWIPENLAFEETVDFVIKKIIPPYTFFSREKIRKIIENQK